LVKGRRTFKCFFDCSFYCDQFRNTEELEESNICSNISCDKVNKLIAEVSTYKSFSSGIKESAEYKSMIGSKGSNKGFDPLDPINDFLKGKKGFDPLDPINDFLKGNNYCATRNQ
jgi:hypothetical protein